MLNQPEQSRRVNSKRLPIPRMELGEKDAWKNEVTLGILGWEFWVPDWAGVVGVGEWIGV